MVKPKLEAVAVRKLLESRGGMKSEPVVVLAIRGYYENSMGKPGSNDRGMYDDAVWIVLPDRCLPFNFNTDPSAYRKGVATLQPGTWHFIPGMHKLGSPTSYEAFRQFGDMTVTRDAKGKDRGYFGINLHRGGEENTSSLGCQTVIASQWVDFRDRLLAALGVTLQGCRRHPTGVDGKEFRYELFSKEEADKILAGADVVR